MLEKAPKKQAILICEDIRQEQGNKITLTGIFADGIIFQDIPDEHTPAVSQFAIYALFDLPAKSCKTKVQILLPSKKIYLESPESEIQVSNTQKTVTFGMKFGNFSFPELGDYTVVFWFDEKKVSHKFNVRTEASQ